MGNEYSQQVIHGNMDLTSLDPGDPWVESWTGLCADGVTPNFSWSSAQGQVFLQFGSEKQPYHEPPNIFCECCY